MKIIFYTKLSSIASGFLIPIIERMLGARFARVPTFFLSGTASFCFGDAFPQRSLGSRGCSPHGS